MKFLVINGPNLNLTQFTEPGMEGQIDFNTLLDYIEAGCAQMDVQVDFFQSNHEGDLIDEIQSSAGRADGIILNPGGYAYYSVAILEALQVCGVPRRGSDAGRPQRQGALPQRGCGLLWLSGPLCRRGGQRDISMPAPTLCSCSGWMAARRRTWCSNNPLSLAFARQLPRRGEPLASRAGCAAKLKA